MPKISIVVDCNEETENHEIHIGDRVITCSSLEELADTFESLELSEAA